MNLKRPDLNSGMLRPMIALEKHKKMTQKTQEKNSVAAHLSMAVPV